MALAYQRTLLHHKCASCAGTEAVLHRYRDLQIIVDVVSSGDAPRVPQMLRTEQCSTWSVTVTQVSTAAFLFVHTVEMSCHHSFAVHVDKPSACMRCV